VLDASGQIRILDETDARTAGDGSRVIRVVVAENYPLMRAGFRDLLTRDRSVEIVGEAENSAALVVMLRSVSADVAIVCGDNPGPGLANLMRQLRATYPALAILVMTMRAAAEIGVEALRLGAAGYVSKDRAGPELLMAVKTVGAGRRYVSPEVAELLADRLERTTRTHRLSPRENAVLVGLADGRSHKQIAAELAVSPKSIGTYRSRVLRKLGLRTTADLVRYTIRRDG
jgi:two-component system, NarL family, invasion response regulator UvrY